MNQLHSVVGTVCYAFLSRTLIIAILLAASIAKAETDWPISAEQAIVVVTPEWESTSGLLVQLQSRNRGWHSKREPIAVTVGHKGLGWGNGLHRPRAEGPQKREGDKRAPAGVFRLEFGFGAVLFREQRFPFRQVSAQDHWVDDPRSKFYNQWVSIGDPRFPQDWKSAEIMNRNDGLYDFVIVVGHNRSPVTPGHGSAIFIHTWIEPGRSTIGCTAMPKAEVKRLLGWLDLQRNPVLIQVPSSELDRLGIPADLRSAIRSSL